MNTTNNINITLTEEVQDIFSDQDLNFKRLLRDLASCFGTEATLHDVAVSLEDYTLPKRDFNGKTLIAGYKGSKILHQGTHDAWLADIKQSGSSAKLMFVVGDRYVFQTLDEWKVDDIVEYTKALTKPYKITVSHEKIHNTGDIHATVIASKAM